MVEQGARVRRRRLSGHGLAFRRRRVFARLREGLTYDEIAAEEGVTPARIRQIVSAELRQREVDTGAEHAKLQLDRLAPAVQLGAEAIAAGDVSAIIPYLRALDRLDRYQTVADASQAYDAEARQKLIDKINRLAENLGLDDPVAVAAQSRAGEPAEAGSEARPPEIAGPGAGLEAPPAEAAPSGAILFESIPTP